jgi:hypothetical protein
VTFCKGGLNVFCEVIIKYGQSCKKLYMGIKKRLQRTWRIITDKQPAFGSPSLSFILRMAFSRKDIANGSIEADRHGGSGRNARER